MTLHKMETDGCRPESIPISRAFAIFDATSMENPDRPLRAGFSPTRKRTASSAFSPADVTSLSSSYELSLCIRSPGQPPTAKKSCFFQASLNRPPAATSPRHRKMPFATRRVFARVAVILSLTSSSILHSKLCTFLIGVDEAPITVHSGAISALSAPLDRAINGHFKEVQENRVRFPDIEVGDFEKICAGAYGAELSLPDVRKLPPSQVNIKEDCWVLSPRIVGPDSVVTRNNKLTAHVLCATIGDLNDLPNVPAKTGSKALYDNSVDDYSRCKFLDPPDEGNLLVLQDLFGDSQEVQVQRHPTWDQDITQALLGYVRIYKFAQEQLITKLQIDAGGGLRNFLGRIDIFPPTRSALLELVQYVYNSEVVPDRDDGEVMHPLREIVVHFMALHLFAFRDFPPHREMTRRGGDYALDLQDVIAEWLL